MFQQREFLIRRLNQSRGHLDELIAAVPRDKQIYPNWTLKEFLAHLSGWDDSTIEALRAHARGEPVGTTVARGIDAYNAQTVSTRAELDLEHILKEWATTRQSLLQALRDLPDEKFNVPLNMPWGETGSVAYFIEIFVDHDEEHAEHLHVWLKNPDVPLTGRH
ncbi:MAG TPA: maleylpyruvate isomerase N-terminal domain-containing protein [Anaerolineales bacterium]|jgi:hypothetical protein